MKFKKALLLLAAVIFLCGSITLYELKDDISDYYAYSNWKPVLSNYGSSGTEVTNIQRKLSNWGYYYGAVDGIYGYQTFQAVKLFQTKNGLSIDGVAGPETLAALGLATGQQAAGGGGAASSSNTDLLAHLIYGEARGEPYLGKVAVAAVVLNRVSDDRFPKTIAGVVYEPGAFDAVDDGQINLQPDGDAYNAARDALNGWDPTSGCIYYYNPATATSSWIWSRPIMLKIGKHNFAK